MSSLHDEEGKLVACTLIEAGPCVVTQVKTKEKDGYEALQLGFGDRKKKHTPAQLAGHFQKANTSPKKKLAEFRDFGTEHKVGDEITVDGLYEEGQFVNVVGTSKGKGFAGAVRRYNFRGVGDATHGQHNRQRAVGSLGAGSYPSRVFKGKRMAGRMGNDRVTIENLRVMKIFPEKNLIAVSGSVPGAKNSYVLIWK